MHARARVESTSGNLLKVVNHLLCLLVGRKSLELNFLVWISCSASCASFRSILKFLLACLTDLDVWHRHHRYGHRSINWRLSVYCFQIVGTNLILSHHSLGKRPLLRHIKKLVRSYLLFRFYLFVARFLVVCLVCVVVMGIKMTRVFVINVHCLPRVLYIYFRKFDAWCRGRI